MSFSELIEAFDVEEYVGRLGTVRPSNKNNVCVTPCPICGDSRRNKFYINMSGDNNNGRWNSYCCHQSGGLVNLVMNVEEMTRPEACSMIGAEVEGSDEDKIIPVVDAAVAQSSISVPQKPQEIEFPSSLYEVTPNTPIVHHGIPQTLYDRGITQSIIDKYALTMTMAPTFYANKIRTELNSRLLIPIEDADGGWISWQARDMTGTAERKYLFPWDDKSSKTLFGWKYASSCKTIVVCEGVFAKWAFDNLGARLGNHAIENMAVCSFGKKLSQTQQNMIASKEEIEKVILAWDLDAAAQIHKVAQALNGRKEVYVIVPPEDGKDYDEIPQEDLMRLIVNAQRYDFAFAARLRARAALSG